MFPPLTNRQEQKQEVFSVQPQCGLLRPSVQLHTNTQNKLCSVNTVESSFNKLNCLVNSACSSFNREMMPQKSWFTIGVLVLDQTGLKYQRTLETNWG